MVFTCLSFALRRGARLLTLTGLRRRAVFSLSLSLFSFIFELALLTQKICEFFEALFHLIAHLSRGGVAAFTLAASSHLNFHILKQLRKLFKRASCAFCVANTVGFFNRLKELFNLVCAAATTAAAVRFNLFSVFGKLFDIALNRLIIALKKRVNLALRRTAGHAFIQIGFCLAHFFKRCAERAKFCPYGNTPKRVGDGGDGLYITRVTQSAEHIFKTHKNGGVFIKTGWRVRNRVN